MATESNSSSDDSKLTFRTITAAEVDRCSELESISFPPDEAASLQSLQYRQKEASPFFMAAFYKDDDDSDKLIGFCNGTKCFAFTHDTMSVHDSNPAAPILAIHGVVVDPAFRRRGIATKMVKHYVQHVMQEAANAVGGGESLESLMLIAKSHLLGFYVNCGFVVNRPSPIVHGQDTWYEVEYSCVPKSSKHNENNTNSSLPCWVIDAFAITDVSTNTGNPAGVVLLPNGSCKSREWKQQAAMQFKHAETAFIWPLEEEKDGVHYKICYFTADGSEVDLCGHATLASAAALFSHNKSDLQQVTFHANGDVLLIAFRAKDASSSAAAATTTTKVAMEFPSKKINNVPDTERKSIVESLEKGLGVEHLDSNEKLVYLGVVEDGTDLFLELTTAGFEEMCSSSSSPIQFDALKSCVGYNRGICVSVLGDDGDGKVDFASRFFGPKVGIPEDPVTGSAHCFLAPYYANKLGKKSVLGHQRSERGGFVECNLVSPTRVEIVGNATTRISGSYWN